MACRSTDSRKSEVRPAVRCPPQGDMIVVEDLWKTYDMGSEQQVHALQGISLRIRHNEYVAIMGPSGSGKSTLMNLIGCLDTPSRGKYWLNGHLVSELNDDELARIRNREIGFVFQTFNLLARATALHNVELPLIYNGTPPTSAIERAKAALRGRGPRDAHEPQAQRALRRTAPARRRRPRPGQSPSIILADEPTGNLDSKTGDEIMALFDELHRRATPSSSSPTSRTSPNTRIASSTSATASSLPMCNPPASAIRGRGLKQVIATQNAVDPRSSIKVAM